MQEEQTTGDIIGQYWAYISAFMFWLLFHGKLGPISFDKGTFFAAAFLFFFWLGESMFETWRYHSPQFIANNISGSCVDPPDIIGDWAVFGLDGFKFFGFYDKGKKRTVVVPALSVYQAGERYCSSTRVEVTPFEELFDEVENTIETKEYSQKRIWFGQISEECGQEDPKLKTLEERMKKQELVNEQLKKLVRGKYEDIEATVDHLRRLGRGGGGVMGWIKRIGKPEEEEGF